MHPLKCALVSHFAVTFHVVCSSSCLEYTLDFCAPLSRAREGLLALLKVKLLLPSESCTSCWGCCPFFHGGLQNICCLACALWTLAFVPYTSSVNTLSFLLVCLFTPRLPWRPCVTGDLANPMGLCSRLMLVTKAFGMRDSGSRLWCRKNLNPPSPIDICAITTTYRANSSEKEKPKI